MPTLELSEKARLDLNSMSQDIAADMHQADPKSASDAECVAEMAISCLQVHNYPETDAEIGELCRVFGYAEVRAEAAKHVSVW